GRRGEALPFEHEARIVRADGNRDLGPVVVSLAPVGGGPLRIQIVESFVFCLQPILKLLARVVVVRHVGVAVFVLDLPAPDVSIVTKTDGYLLADAAAELTVTSRRRGGV